MQASTTSRPHGALVLTADRYSFVEDTFYVNSIGEPYLFSLWIYEESNGLPGLQRGDPVCDSTPAGHDADTIVN